MSEAARLRDVSDTALLVAVHRALESERQAPLFRDPYARLLAGERGERIVAGMRFGRTNWPVVVRTVFMDAMIERAVRAEGVSCVLNLAAGLDARPYRMDLPASLRWVEADLPAMLDYKAERLAGERPRCRLERRPLDLTDAPARRALFDELAGAPTLVLTEGLLVYLTREDVAALGRELAGRRGFDWWLCDVAGPLFLQLGRRGDLGRQLAAANATMQFAPEEGLDFFGPLGWQPVEARSSWEEASRLGRLPWVWRAFWRLNPRDQRARYRDMTRCALLRRAGSTEE